ncbi:hypothetical protein G3N30_09765 [Microbacterium lacticum]|uniref:hypothetical protein n=1 Tax=Microbacterium lacticum TaxID=33885 RepID=UPI0018B08325|nr:hypothetical protein [Microbacterium lacticum]MBF9336493.1 hypothetical protein [Microbacterium lacticum]
MGGYSDDGAVVAADAPVVSPGAVPPLPPVPPETDDAGEGGEGPGPSSTRV